MARKTMTKEVTSTLVKCAKMNMIDGLPVAEPLEDEVLIGNVTLEMAQKTMTKKHGAGIVVFEVKADTKIYEMLVEEFIKVANVKETN